MQNQLPFETKVKTAENAWLLHECRRLLNLERGIRFARTSVSVWRYKDVRRIERGRGESNPFTPKTSSFVIYWHPMVKLDVHVFKPLTYMYHSCLRRYLALCTEMWNTGLFRRIVLKTMSIHLNRPVQPIHLAVSDIFSKIPTFCLSMRSGWTSRKRTPLGYDHDRLNTIILIHY